jgi:hypothetical protein
VAPPGSAVAFIQSLLEAGRVKVPPGDEPPDGIHEAIADLDRVARSEAAFGPPALSAPAASWALTIVYRAAQALVFREIDADAVRHMLAVPCPLPPSPSVHYSADLSLRYLPDLLALARGIAPDDPLVAGHTALARAWPLSSVGVAGAGEVDPSAFLNHPSLRQLYVDRIIERSDASRLAHPAVRAAVLEAVGAYPSLAPKLSPHLQVPGH